MNTSSERVSKLATGAGLPDELWTVDELAAYLRVSKKFVYRLNSEGRIKYDRIGREVRYSSAQVREFLEAEAPELLRPLKPEYPPGQSGGRRRRSRERSKMVVSQPPRHPDPLEDDVTG